MAKEVPMARWCYPEYLLVRRGANDRASYQDAQAIAIQGTDGDVRLALAHGHAGLCDLFDSVGITTFRTSGLVGGQKKPEPLHLRFLLTSHADETWIAKAQPPILIDTLSGYAIAWVVAQAGGLCPLLFSMATILPRGGILFPFDPVPAADDAV